MGHIHEKIDFSVEIFIVHKNKVLLRMHDKLGFWLSVGGHIELNEDPVEAAIREVKEEVGLDIKIIGEADGPLHGEKDNRNYKYLIPPRYLGRHPINEKHEHIVFVYFAKAETDLISESILEHEKGVEMKWMAIDDLNKNEFIPNVKFYAVKALEELGEK